MRIGYGLLLAFTAACGGGGDGYATSPPPGPPPGPPPAPPPAPAPTLGVSIADYSYAPDTVRIKAGGSVRWRNNGPTTHSVVANGGEFNSGPLSGPVQDPTYGETAGETFVQMFTSAGTFTYHCGVHPGMLGAVVVTP